MVEDEVGVLVATGVFAGLISTDALGANQIVLNVATITYMVPIAIAQAATVRCALELGAGRADCGPAGRLREPTIGGK